MAAARALLVGRGRHRSDRRAAQAGARGRPILYGTPISREAPTERIGAAFANLVAARHTLKIQRSPVLAGGASGEAQAPAGESPRS
ncbi:hypothetical protein [Solimonas variicoloris]|uniref:hypothetical protein n=1 Tax=Solimonas variicoloris TaxID=254408 RepID=UPI000378A6AB|nr:hypothetical protein [Solimonas variicoloris]